MPTRLGRYTLLGKLAQGGMAELFLAKSEGIEGFEKIVVLKRILPSFAEDEEFIELFVSEARLAAQLDHANIVHVHDIGRDGTDFFFTMEYLHGHDVRHLLNEARRREHRLPLKFVLAIVAGAAAGLHHAHKQVDFSGRPLGIVHRDISPPNILVSWNGEVKLTDFGLAKASTQLESTDPGVVKGKFAYLAPEAAHGESVDHRADIFAVGILAYEMLTGQRLFLADTDYDTVQNVRAAEIPSMRAVNPEIPAELEEIIRCSLSRDAKDRYQNASEFADDLLGFLFSRKLKVSARTLRTLLDDMRQKEPAPAPQPKPPEQGNVILRLIEEEFTTFKSIDEDSDAPELGSQPLDSLMAGNMPINYDPAAPLALDEFDVGPSSSPDNEPTPPPAASSSTTAPEGIQATLHSTGNHRVVPSGGGGRSMVPILAVLLLIAAGAGAAVYMLFLK